MEVARLRRLEENLKRKYGSLIDTKLTPTQISDDIVVGAELVVRYGQNMLALGVSANGSVEFLYNYFSNPSKLVVKTGTSVDNFASKLVTDLSRRHRLTKRR